MHSVCFLKQWSRCGEITCDRAGLICCGDPVAAETALVRLIVGYGKNFKEINVDEYLTQLDDLRSRPARLLEFFSTHPLIAKRVEALRVFRQCDLLSDWLPELRIKGKPELTKKEVDDQCNTIISIIYSHRWIPSPPMTPQDSQLNMPTLQSIRYDSRHLQNTLFEILSRIKNDVLADSVTSYLSNSVTEKFHRHDKTFVIG